MMLLPQRILIAKEAKKGIDWNTLFPDEKRKNKFTNINILENIIKQLDILNCVLL